MGAASDSLAVLTCPNAPSSCRSFEDADRSAADVDRSQAIGDANCVEEGRRIYRQGSRLPRQPVALGRARPQHVAVACRNRRHGSSPRSGLGRRGWTVEGWSDPARRRSPAPPARRRRRSLKRGRDVALPGGCGTRRASSDWQSGSSCGRGLYDRRLRNSCYVRRMMEQQATTVAFGPSRARSGLACQSLSGLTRRPAPRAIARDFGLAKPSGQSHVDPLESAKPPVDRRQRQSPRGEVQRGRLKG